LVFNIVEGAIIVLLYRSVCEQQKRGLHSI